MAKLLKDLPIGAKFVDPNTLYKGKPIVWVVAHQIGATRPTHGPSLQSTTLVAKDIITLKQMDAAEPNNSISEIRSGGNKYYPHSNIRQWLNASGTNWYQPQGMYDKWPNYDYESGFLTDFATDFLTKVINSEKRNQIGSGTGVESLRSKVHLLSAVEVGLPEYGSYTEGIKLDLFSDNASRVAVIGDTVNDANYPLGVAYKYGLRTNENDTNYLRAVGATGANASTLPVHEVGIRPLIEVQNDVVVSDNINSNGIYELTRNASPIVLLTSPAANQTLYENDTLNIAGNVSDADIGNSVTVRYQINASAPKAIKAFVSTGAAEAFSKNLTFRGGSLYDGDTLIASGLVDGVPHTLKVWGTDDQGGTSPIVERTFYVVPNRAPRLEVTPPTIEGNIDSDTFTVSGIYADDDKNEVIISYRINGSISKEVARGTDGTFDFTLSLAQLKNGNNTISVEAIDSYGAKTSRTIKLNKNTIATPLLQSTVRYLIQPPKGSAQAVLLWLQRDQDLAVTASLHMGMKGEAEAFTLLEPTNTAPLRDNAAILEDEFYHEADSAKDHIILQLDMKRSSVESTAAIHLISGVFE